MNLALLGKDIQHSLSPSLYKRFLGSTVDYFLLDLNEKELPSIKELFEVNKLNGLNITAPYKSHYIDDVIIERDSIYRIGGINCIKFQNGKFYGENTDELAFKQLFNHYLAEYGFKNIILLGDGVMAQMIKLIIEPYNINFTQKSRRKDKNIENLSIDKSEYSSTLIINACSRNYVYGGPLSSEILFWDMNYKMSSHKTKIPNYIDGEGLLELQAKLAIDFFKSE